MQSPKPNMNPYFAGIGQGHVLIAAFVVMGRGLGASGALSSVVTLGVNTISPMHAQSNPFYIDSREKRTRKVGFVQLGKMKIL